MRFDPDRRGAYAVLLAAVTLLALGLRLRGAGEQPLLNDEVMTAFTAESYVERGQLGPVMPFHPNLRNLLLYATTRLFGQGLVGLRGPSLLLGTLSVPLLALLVARLFRDRRAALIAALLLALDPVHVTFSRQSIQEVHTAFFLLAGVLAFLLGSDEGWRPAAWSSLRPLWLPVAGVAFGLATASKHHGLFPLAVCLALAVYGALREEDAAWPPAALSVASLTLVPATVYLATYAPWFRRGYSLLDWLAMQRDLFGLMIHHTGYETSSPIDDRAWLWFIKPLVGYGNFNFAGDRPAVTVAVANPLVWLLVLPAAWYLLRHESKSPGSAVVQLLFWASYLPLALSSRPIWLLSAVAVLPFALALVARFLSRQAPRHPYGLAAYLAAVALVALLLYPMAAGEAWDHDYLRPLAARWSPHAAAPAAP